MHSKVKRDPAVKPLLFETYLAVIKNSLGSKMFRQAFADVDGKTRDIMRYGELSCAFYVSFVLKFFDLVEEPHATVNGLEKDLEHSGWKKIRKPKPGCVLVWEPGGESRDHRHVGFYVGNNSAISNSSTLRKPTKHHWTYGTKNGKPKRKIEAMYWHKKLSTVSY